MLIKASLLAFGMHTVLMAMTQSVVGLAYQHADKDTLPVRIPAGPIDLDGDVIKCYPHSELMHSQEVFTNAPYSRSTSFSIPVSSDVIYFFSRGSFGYGSLRFELSDKTEGDIDVDVTLDYYHEEILKHIRVCLLERKPGERGIGFFTPDGKVTGLPERRLTVGFKTVIRIPRSGSQDDPLFIKSLETNMGIWSHHVDSLEDLVNFGSISFTGENALIRVLDVSSIKVVMKTINSSITGRFNVSESINLRTDNSPILADIRLENADGRKPTKLDMTTANSAIQALISLASITNSETTVPAFSVTAETSYSPLSIAFSDAPTSPFSKLKLVATNSIGKADVTLHPTYEGLIFQTGLIPPKLVVNENTEDPSGNGRHRSISQKSGGSVMDVKVWWGDEEDKKANWGDVEVITSFYESVVTLH